MTERPRKPSRARRLFRTLALLVALVFLAAGAAAAWGWKELRAFGDTPYGSSEEKVLEIPSGARAHQVVRLLARGGALSDDRRAWWWLRLLRRERRPLKAGEYAFAGPLRPDEVIDRLVRGEVKLHQVTIPEGLRMEEIAQAVEEAGLGRASELLGVMKDPAVARALGVPLANLEGFLFPDTYSFPRGPKARAVVNAMVGRFKQAWKEADAQRSPDVQLNEVEAVTLASIIEKETGQPDERPRISCVFHNRLRLGMRLQTDPTVQYATMLRTGEFPQNVTRADLTAMHPYNTYQVQGLPPGPIASPGQAALDAALHPARCDDLYFVSRNDGTHVFCPTLECHNAAVRTWQIEYFKHRRAGR